MLEREELPSRQEAKPSNNTLKNCLVGRSLAVAAALMLGAPLLNVLSSPASAADSPYFFYSGGKRNHLPLSKQWAAVQLESSASAASVTSKAEASGLVADNAKFSEVKRKKVVILPLDSKAGRLSPAQVKAQLGGIAGVARTLRAYGDSGEPIVETGEFVVRFKAGVSPGQAKALLARYQSVPIKALGAYAPNGYLARLKDSSKLTALGVANALYESGITIFSHPNFIWPISPRQVPTPTPDPFATPQPTSSPTPQPTGSPTPQPTGSPTPQPTGSPTAEPTGSPTPLPTGSPTPQPTSQPTTGPTAQPTVIGTPSASDSVNDPLYPQQWHLNNTGQVFGQPDADVDAPEAWTVTKGDPKVVVAVIDTGIDIDHEDLKDKIVFPYDARDNDTDPRPDPFYSQFTGFESHGTSVSGVAVGTGDNSIGITGVAPNCKLMPIRLLNDIDRQIPLEAISRAFLWAASHGADVINNSWGPDTDLVVVLPDAVKEAIDYATTRGRNGKGCVVLFASGNSSALGQTVDNDGFASYDKVIAVGASNSSDRRTYYSEYGKNLDIVAPSGEGSVNIVTTDRTGTAGYDRGGIGSEAGFESGNYTPDFNGTSSACPLVAGIVALVLSENPDMTYSQVYARLTITADKIDATNAKYDEDGFSEQYGYGRVNAFKALIPSEPEPTIITPPDNAVIPAGTYTVSARTGNNSLATSVQFSQRGLFNQAFKTVNKAIPDATLNDSGILTDEVTLPATTASGNTQAIVSVNIKHSYIGDVQVTLIAPDGTATILYDHTGGSATTLNTTYTLPSANRPLTGTYKIEVSDDAQEDVGTLVSWGIKLVTDWTDIGTATSPDANGLYSVPWTVTSPGLYEVRAIVNTKKYGTFTDINTNIRVGNSGPVATKVSVSGTIVNKNKVGVAGVKVTLGDRAALTNSRGVYTFANVNSGTYTVTPSQLRSVFTPTNRRVSVGSKDVTGVNFELTATDSVPPTITVTAPAVAPNNRYKTLAAATGTVVDTGSGIASVTGLLYRYAAGTTVPAGYWAGGTNFTAKATAANEIAARLITVGGRTTYSLALPSLTTGTYTFRATATDKAGNVTRSATVVFIVDGTAPVVKILQPTDRASNLASFFKLVTGTATDAGTVSSVTVMLARAAKGTTPAGYWNGRTYSTTYVPANNEVAATLTGNSWKFSLPTLTPNVYTIRATATDKVGNVGRSETVRFTVKETSTGTGTTAVVALGASPVTVSGVAASSADNAVRLHFSSALEAESAADATHYRVAVDGQEVAVEGVTYTAGSSTVTLLLPAGTVTPKSTVAVSWGGLLDAQGRLLEAGGQQVSVR